MHLQSTCHSEGVLTTRSIAFRTSLENESEYSGHQVRLGIAAPKATPIAVVGKLNEVVNAILADPKMVARLAELGGAPLVLSPAAFGKLIIEETDKWGKVIKAANIKAE